MRRLTLTILVMAGGAVAPFSWLAAGLLWGSVLLYFYERASSRRSLERTNEVLIRHGMKPLDG